MPVDVRMFSFNFRFTSLKYIFVSILFASCFSWFIITMQFFPCLALSTRSQWPTLLAQLGFGSTTMGGGGIAAKHPKSRWEANWLDIPWRRAWTAELNLGSFRLGESLHVQGTRIKSCARTNVVTCFSLARLIEGVSPSTDNPNSLSHSICKLQLLTFLMLGLMNLVN